MTCVQYGAHALGFVFYNKSPRFIELEQAKHIFKRLPPFVTTVGLFVNPESAYVEQIISQLPLDLLQFHGHESAEFCQQFSRPYIKAIGVKHPSDIIESVNAHLGAKALLLDKYDPVHFGGTGRAFDWSMLPEQCDKPLILAGGLTPENVANAIQNSAIYAVDVSSGVERAKGLKDPTKIEQFMKEVASVR